MLGVIAVTFGEKIDRNAREYLGLGERATIPLAIANDLGNPSDDSSQQVASPGRTRLIRLLSNPKLSRIGQTRSG